MIKIKTKIAFAEFDQAMSQVNAVTQETTANMGLLREAILEAWGRRPFTDTGALERLQIADVRNMPEGQ